MQTVKNLLLVEGQDWIGRRYQRWKQNLMFTYPLNMMNFLSENSRQGMPLKQRYNKYQRISRKGMLLVLVKDCRRTILAIFGIVKLDSDRRSGGRTMLNSFLKRRHATVNQKYRAVHAVYQQLISHFCWGGGGGDDGDKWEF